MAGDTLGHLEREQVTAGTGKTVSLLMSNGEKSSRPAGGGVVCCKTQARL